MLVNLVGLQNAIPESVLVDGGAPPDRANLLRAIHHDGTNAGGQSNLTLASQRAPLSARYALDSMPGLARLASVNTAAPSPLADALTAIGVAVGPGGSSRLKPRAVRERSRNKRNNGLVEDDGVRSVRAEIKARGESATYGLSGFGWLDDKWAR